MKIRRRERNIRACQVFCFFIVGFNIIISRVKICFYNFEFWHVRNVNKIFNTAKTNCYDILDGRGPVSF